MLPRTKITGRYLHENKHTYTSVAQKASFTQTLRNNTNQPKKYIAIIEKPVELGPKKRRRKFPNNTKHIYSNEISQLNYYKLNKSKKYSNKEIKKYCKLKYYKQNTN